MARVDPIPLPLRQHSLPHVLWIGARQKSGRLVAGLGDIFHLRPSQIHTVSVYDIDEQLLSRVRPTVACSMLTWIGGDAFEAANALSVAGYTGRYCAFGPQLPAPHLVEQEIAASAPNVDFSIMSFGYKRS